MIVSYEALSPWAESLSGELAGIAPRLDTLSGKTIGMFAHFKGHALIILRLIADEIGKHCPDVNFTYFQYPKETSEILEDAEYLPQMKDWLTDCDGIICAYGDAGSCALYHAINAAAVERLGKPTVSLVKDNLIINAERGASLRMVPKLRTVPCELLDLSLYSALGPSIIEQTVRNAVIPAVPGLIDGLIRPLSDDEARPNPPESAEMPSRIFKGTLREINKEFYKRGFTNGIPVIPPTRDAVDEMLTGTDLRPEDAICVLPPTKGIATVEKLAINAVMAGCLPTHFPIIIAAAKALAAPEISLTGWTCSVAGFAPLIIINGPIRRDIALNCTDNILSPYFIANAAIARAVSLIILNIAGVRPTLEDRAYSGHEARFGVCFGEDEEHSPWAPYHTDCGFSKEDSTVTLVWFQNRQLIKGGTEAAGNLKILCSTDDIGFKPGATFIVSNTFAKTLNDAGFSKKDVLNYVCEYARKPAKEAPLDWLRNNNHLPESVPLPLDIESSVRKYWDTKHLQLIVASSGAAPRGVAMLGGGDHGGPVTAKADLPKNWSSLVKSFEDYIPEYI